MERDVRYCTTEDGVRIAYCVEGEGPPLVVEAEFAESFSLLPLRMADNPCSVAARRRGPADLGSTIRPSWAGKSVTASPMTAYVLPIASREKARRLSWRPSLWSRSVFFIGCRRSASSWIA